MLIRVESLRELCKNFLYLFKILIIPVKNSQIMPYLRGKRSQNFVTLFSLLLYYVKKIRA